MLRHVTRSPRFQRGEAGQSLVELAIVLPIVLVLTLIALDFGRIYLGWINLQNMSRIAANFAANNPTAWAKNDATVKARYQAQILSDAAATNCQLPLVGGVQTAPDPVFIDANGDGINNEFGDRVSVGITCRFQVITPIISALLGGGQVNVSSASTFPVKNGIGSGGGGGGGGGGPTADFSGTPLSGVAPLAVQFTDLSTGAPTTWAWDFNNDGTVDSTAQSPSFVYNNPGLYTVKLTVSNALGSSTRTRSNYVGVSSPPPNVAFHAVPTSGTGNTLVQFTDDSTGGPFTAWAWDFDNNGATDSTAQNPTHTYAPGTYSVKLTVTNSGGPASLVKTNYITIGVGNCTVPDFTGQRRNNAQGIWTTAGFTTTVADAPGAPNGNYSISFQTIVGNSIVPCNSSIQVR